jgi:hypothetical protein
LERKVIACAWVYSGRNRRLRLSLVKLLPQKLKVSLRRALLEVSAGLRQKTA